MPKITINNKKGLLSTLPNVLLNPRYLAGTGDVCAGHIKKKRELVTTWNTHTLERSSQQATGEESRPKKGKKHSTGSFQKASPITDLQGPFQGTHGRSSRHTAAGLKALAPKARGQARRHVFPRAAPRQPAQRRVPRGGGQGRAGGRQDISLSLYLDYFEIFKK